MNSGIRVIGGPQEAINEMDAQSAHDFLVGKGNDPSQEVERLEERLPEDED